MRLNSVVNLSSSRKGMATFLSGSTLNSLCPISSSNGYCVLLQMT